MTTFRRTTRACLSLFRIRFAENLQYRLSGLSSVAIGAFWAIIETLVLTVFYTHAEFAQASINGLTLPMAVSYLWMSQAIRALIGMGIDGEINQQIERGDVGIELCRPLDLYAHWYAKVAAGRLGGMWLRGPLTVLVGFLMPTALRMSGPASLEGLLLFLLSLLSAFLLSTAYTLLITAVRLRITWGMGPIHILLLVPQVLSGAFLPLQLWPDALQKVLLLQPFAGYADIPLRLYVGSMAPADGLPLIALQLAWTAAFIVGGRLLMRHQLKSLIIQGG